MFEPTTSETAGDVRRAVREWLADEWDPDVGLREWRERLCVSGWGRPTWPIEWYGRDLDTWVAPIVVEEFVRANAVGCPGGLGLALIGPTLLSHGSEELKQRLLRQLVTGEHHWCQLFSEPGAGSDLAGVTTKAERDGDEWVVNGQKVWTTSAHVVQYASLLARTDWTAPKHQGLTYFVIPMDQPGVVVRPLRQMNGYISFNEVFLDDARVPDANVVGEVHKGWQVALTTLEHERTGGLPVPPVPATGEGRTLDEARQEAAIYGQPHSWYPQRSGRVDLLTAQAERHGRQGDRIVRQAVASSLTASRLSAWNEERAAARRVQGKAPGPEGSIGKLSRSRIAKAAAAAHAQIAGPSAVLAGADGALEGLVEEVLLSVPSISIAGGTDEIQKNILAERLLGLPKEPDVSRSMPFRDVPKNQ